MKSLPDMMKEMLDMIMKKMPEQIIMMKIKMREQIMMKIKMRE